MIIVLLTSMLKTTGSSKVLNLIAIRVNNNKVVSNDAWLINESTK